MFHPTRKGMYDVYRGGWHTGISPLLPALALVPPRIRSMRNLFHMNDNKIKNESIFLFRDVKNLVFC